MLILQMAVGSFIGLVSYDLVKRGLQSRNPTIAWLSSIILGANFAVFAYLVTGAI